MSAVRLQAPTIMTIISHKHHHDQEPVTNATVTKGGCCSGGHHNHEHAKDKGLQLSAIPHHHEPTTNTSVNKSGCCSAGSCSELKAAHVHNQEAPTGKQSRAVFRCTDICCASEIPLINTILQPQGGITDVKIKVATQQIVVEYDNSIITADEINELLNAGGFTSTEQRDEPVVTGKTGRSHFLVKRICCASEIPAINTILEHKMGVFKVTVNVTAKMVYVDHDTSIVSAQELCDALNADHFDAFLEHDGAPTRTDALGRSHFFVEKICCASEIPAINAILEPIGGVNKVQINVTTKTVYVDHDTSVVTAQTLCDALNRDRFGAEVRHDAQEDMGAPLTSFVRSTFSFSVAKEHANEVFTAFMETYGPNQVESCVIDLPQHLIYVIHNPLVLPADELCDVYKRTSFSQGCCK
jgi:copper chaperone CopZ